MKRTLFFLLAFFQVTIALAQSKQLVPEEIMSNRKLYPASLNNIQWMGSSESFTWQDANSVIKGSARNSQTDTILKLDNLNNLLKASGKTALRRIPFISWIDDKIMAFTTGTEFYTLSGGILNISHTLPVEAQNQDMSVNRKFVAYTIDNNLFISDGENQSAVTSDKDKWIVNGQTVHRNEFGISKGTFWSSSGNKLAFYRMDESMVTEYPLVDITQRIAEEEPIRYPMAGMTSHQVTVGVYDTQTGKTIFLKTGEPKEQYLTNLAWSPDDKYIFLAVVNRDQNHMKFNQYDAVSGDFVMTLFEEKNDRYVEPLVPMVFLPGSNDQFIWQSQRDGYNHLYLYNTDGRILKQLTIGQWVVTGLTGFSADGKGLFYTSSEVSPAEDHLFYLDLKSGNRKQLTKERGTHNTVISPSSRYFITTFSNLQTPPVSELVEIKSGKTTELKRAENPLDGYDTGEASIFNIKAADNVTDLYCRLIKPAGFNPSKKYPVFIYVYGGPHSQLVTDTWMSGGLFLRYMAQQGYVVFTLDNRGSSNRGFEFESIIHRNIGKNEMADQMKGVEYLMSLPFVDKNRIGVDGWSYGGFMSVNMKLNHPDIFKVATAGGPVCDWKYYEVMYGERYMDTPEQNPEGYKASSLIEQAGKLQGKLLIIHGGIDNTVVWQHSLDFLRACIDNKKQLDYFVYPTHEHNVGGIDRAHLFRKIAEYFNENL